MMRRMNYCLCCFLWLFACIIKVCYSGSSNLEYKLIDDVLRNYNKHIRPITKSGDISMIKINLALFDILELDTKEERLRINSELILKWYDSHIYWNPQEYGNISLIRIPHDQIWIPDVVLYNTADPDYEGSLLATNVIVEHTGLVEIVFHALFSSVCSVDVEYYPFDQQTCKLRFASWTYDESELYLVLGKPDISKFKENQEFALEDFYAKQYDKFNPCCEHPMSAVVFHIQLQRRTKFSIFFFVMPGILINLCALLVFSLPAESGEKVVLGISSMIAMIVFLMEMTFHLPPTNTIPLVGIYYGSGLTLITINIAFGVLIMNINVAGERKKKVPVFLKQITMMIARMLGDQIPDNVRKKWIPHENDTDYSGNLTIGNVVKVAPMKEPRSPSAGVRRRIYPELQNTKFVDSYQRRMIDALEEITKQMENDYESAERDFHNFVNLQEWKFTSRVFDHFLFYVFIIAVVVLVGILLLSSPYWETFEYCPIAKKECEGLSKQEIYTLIDESH